MDQHMFTPSKFPAPSMPPVPCANVPRAISPVFGGLLTSAFAFQLKIENCYWNLSHSAFRGYHMMLAEQAMQLSVMTRLLAQQVCEMFHVTMHAVTEVTGNPAFADTAPHITLQDTLAELRKENGRMVDEIRRAQRMTSAQNDATVARLLQTFMDETEQRADMLSRLRTVSGQTDGRPVAAAMSPRRPVSAAASFQSRRNASAANTNSR